jgi:hypothetical protein
MKNNYMQNENDAGYVINKINSETYLLVDDENNQFKANIPSDFHYSYGDSVLQRHIYNEQCISCGNDMMYDSKESEWYCPRCDI